MDFRSGRTHPPLCFCICAALTFAACTEAPSPEPPTRRAETPAISAPTPSTTDAAAAAPAPSSRSLDLGGIVERARHFVVDAPGDDVWSQAAPAVGAWGTNDDVYEARFGEGAHMAFRPRVGDVVGTEVGWRTDVVSYGGQASTATVRKRAENRVSYHHDDVVETWEARDGVVEQTWTLPARRSGDFVVRGAFLTDATAEITETGIHWGGADMGVHVSNVTVVDAAGRTLQLRHELDGAVATLRVPGQWLEKAAFPVVVDPVWVGESGTDNPVYAANGAAKTAVGPVAASDYAGALVPATQVFVAWVEQRSAPYQSGNGIYGVVVTEAGSIVSGGPLAIATGDYSHSRPAVAHTAGTWFVTWTDNRGQGVWVRGALLTQANPRTQTNLVVSQTATGIGAVAAGADGTRFHVAFSADGNGKDIFLASVTTAGVLTGPVNVTNAAGDQRTPDIAGGAGRAVLAWRNDAAANIQGKGVVATNHVGTTRTFGTTNDPKRPSVSCHVDTGATVCRAAWHTEGGATFDVRSAAANVANSGLAAPDAAIDIDAAAGNQHNAHVLMTPAGFTVAYENVPDAQSSDIVAKGLLHNGTVVFTLAVASGVGDEIGPGVVSIDDSLGYTWNDNNGNINYRNADALGQNETTAIVINRAANAQTDPAVAFNGTYYLVSWVDARAGTDIYATRVNTAGVVLDAGGIAVQVGGANAAPVNCENGDDFFLVAWSSAGNAVKAARIASGGGSQGVLDVKVAATDILVDGVRCSYANDRFLVGWGEDQLGVKRIHARNINDGNDTLGNVKDVVLTDRGEWGLTNVGSDNAVVWANTSTGAITARRLDRNGTPQPETATLATVAGTIDSVDALAIGTNFFAFWSEVDGDGDVTAVRIATSLVGNTLKTPLVLEGGAADARQVSVARLRANYLAVSWVVYNGDDRNIRGAELTVDDAQNPNGLTIANTNPFDIAVGSHRETNLDSAGDGAGEALFVWDRFVPTDRDARRVVGNLGAFNRLPVPNISAVASANEGASVAFNATGTVDIDGDTLSYAWDFTYDGVTFNTEDTGATVNHTFTDDFNGNVALRVNDGAGGVVTATHAIQILNVNPVAAAGADQQVNEGVQVNFAGTGTDAGAGDVLSYAWDFNYIGNNFTTDATGQNVSHTYADNTDCPGGTCVVAFRVTDDNAGFHIDTLEVDVANVAPVANAGNDQTVNEGALVTFNGSGTDVPADPVTLAWDLDNDGAFDDGVGTTATFTYPDNGVVTARLRATDDDGASHIDTLVVTVNNVAPTANAGENQTVNEGTQITLNGSGSTDPGTGDTLSYAWDLDADGQYDDATGPIVMHTYNDEVTVVVGLRVTDDDNGVGTDTVQITVLNVTPVVNAGNDQTVNEGVQVNFSGSAIDPGADGLTYEWDLDGDGQFDDATGTAANYTYPDDAVVTVRLRVTDEDGAAGTDSLTVTVQNVAPANVNNGGNKTGNEGQQLTFNGSATDVAADPLTFRWDFDNNGTFDATGPTVQHAYPDNGVFTFKLRVTDGDGGQTDQTATATIANVAPSNTQITAVATANEGASVSFAGSTFDPGTADTITYAWTFGDGGNASGANVSHTYADQGSFTVTLTVTDDDGGSHATTHGITILNVAPTVNMVEFVGVAQGVETDFEATVTDPGADPLFYTWSVICNDLPDQNDCNDNDEYEFAQDRVGFDLDTVPIVFNDFGSYTVTLSVSDGDGGVTVGMTDVEVANEPPVVILTADPTTLNEGQTVSFTGGATDPGGDALTYFWNYGDGITQNGNLSRTHTYTNNGVFTALLRATDTNQESGQATVEITVLNVTPVATVVDRTPQENDSTAFTVNIVDPGADTHSCVWNFGDNTPPVTDANCGGVSHTYVNDGVFALTVTVNDGAANGVGTATIRVSNVPPNVLFANHTGVEGTAVEFTASANDRSPADVLSYHWNFGDNTAPVVTAEPAVSHTYTNNRVYSVVLTVNDGTDNVVETRTATITNVAPTVFAGEDITVNEGAVAPFAGTATDPGADTLVYTWDLDNDGQFDDGTGPTATFTYPDNAVVQARLRVFDGDATVTDTLQVTVLNVAPTVNAGANRTINEGASVTFAGSATDPGADTLTYNWIYGDGQTGNNVGPTPAHTYTQEGVFTARLTVLDDDGGSGTSTVRITVNNVAPSVTITPVNNNVAEGSQISLSATVTDPGADTLTYTWDYGDGDTRVGTNLNTVQHTWVQQGQYTVRLTVHDGTAATTQTITVNVINVPPTVNAGNDVTIDEGATVTFAPVIADPGNDTLTYAWTFGEGGVSTDRAPSHRFRQQGVFTVTLAVNDQTATVTDTLTVTVNNVAPTVNAGVDATRNEGQEYQFNAVATDPGPDDVLTYHWDYGDGQTESGRNLNRPRHTWADDKPGEEVDEYTVTLRVEDRDGGSTTDTLIVRVNNVAPTVNAGVDLVGNEGSLVVFNGTATDPGADPLTFNWAFGDGATASGIALTQPTHIYRQNGNYTVTLTVDDGDGGVVVDTLAVRVNNVAPAVVGVDPEYSGNEGQPITLAVRTFDPGADTLRVAWNYRDGAMEDGDALNSVTHTWADDGIYDVIVTVTDGDGGQATVVLRTVISNVAPTIQSRPTLFGSQDVEYVYQAVAVDPGADVLTWDLQNNPTGMVVDRNTGRVRWTPNLVHVNTQPEGGWPVVLRVRDDELGAATQEFRIDLSFTDDDSDGIADSCEARCVGDFIVGTREDPEGDFDNDGIDNRTECGQGTSMCVTNAPAAPTPVSPTDGFLQEAVPVTLVVQNAVDPDNDTLTYTFEVFAAGDTETPVFTSAPVPEGQAQTSRAVTQGEANFEEDADYVWRCRAADEHASGPWSVLRRFRLSLENDTPSVPQPVAPIGSAMQLMPVLTVTNAVDPEGEALEYDFQVFIVEDELPELILESYGNREGDGRSTWQVERPLTENVVYKWRARATDVRRLSSRWSEMVSFLVNTQNSLPEAPVLLWPEPNGAVETAPAVLVSSEAVDADGDELEYVFTVASDEAFGEVIATSERLVPDARREITYEVGAALEEDRGYFWQVQAFDGEGGGAVATRKFRFTTRNVAPPAVTVQSPAQGESVPVADPDFVWLNVAEPDGDDVQYDVEIFADAAAAQRLYIAEALAPASGTTTTWSGPALLDNTSFWWRVRAVDATGQVGAWSDLTGFFINVRNDAPEAPLLERPATGEAIPEAQAPVFGWINAFDPDGDELTYTVEVFGVADGERVLRESGIAQTEGVSSQWSAPDLLPPGAYSWHVRASDAAQDGPWSVDGVFAVAKDAPADTPDEDPDAGGDPGPDASYPDETPSCGCQTPAEPTRPVGALWLLTAVAVFALRRYAVR